MIANGLQRHLSGITSENGWGAIKIDVQFCKLPAGNVDYSMYFIFQFAACIFFFWLLPFGRFWVLSLFYSWGINQLSSLFYQAVNVEGSLLLADVHL